VSFKIFTKVETNRVTKVGQVVWPTHMTFMLGRHILERVLILHETIHELPTKKMDGVLLKIDFDIACDEVQWSCLQQVMGMKVSTLNGVNGFIILLVRVVFVLK
jgi:hypothetical protein